MTEFSQQPLWIVTGAAGFVGNNLVRILLERGERVRANDLPAIRPESLQNLDCEYVPADITDEQQTRELFRHDEDTPVIVVHLAAIISILGSGSPELRRTNVLGTKSVINACRSERVARLVYVSTVHTIPEPTQPRVVMELDRAEDFNPNNVVGEYAKTKTEATAAVLEATDLWRVVVHPSGIIGPGAFSGNHLSRMISDVASGRMKVLVNGGYDFVDVRDVCLGIIASAEQGENGRCYLLSGEYRSVKSLVNSVASSTGQRQRFRTLPNWFAKLVAYPAELYYQVRNLTPLFTRYSLYTLESQARFSNARARRELGYSSRPLDETIRDTVNWLKTRGEVT